MDDWKKKAAEKAQEEYDNTWAGQREKRKREKELREKQEAEERDRVYGQMLAEKFKCHICGKLDSAKTTVDEQHESGYDGIVTSTWYSPRPRKKNESINNRKCKKCGQYACYEHIYEGKCQHCWRL